MESSPEETPKSPASEKSPRTIPNAQILLCSIGLTVLAALSLPMHFSKKYKADISITATGVKSANVKGVEVWVSETSGPGIVASANGVGWERRDNLQVSYQSQPATLSWSGEIDPEYRLNFVRHAYSGQMILNINGQIFEHALYSENDHSPLIIRPYELMVNPQSIYRALPSNRGNLLTTVFTLIGLFIIIHLILLLIIRRSDSKSEHIATP